MITFLVLTTFLLVLVTSILIGFAILIISLDRSRTLLSHEHHEVKIIAHEIHPEEVTAYHEYIDNDPYDRTPKHIKIKRIESEAKKDFIRQLMEGNYFYTDHLEDLYDPYKKRFVISTYIGKPNKDTISK
jgi:hypothetical protein